jgi:hypothetical protein
MRSRMIIVFLLLSHTGFGQQPAIDFIKDLISQVIEDLPADYDLSELEERLMHYYKHPINLNGENLEALDNLIFLSPLKINQIRQHIKEKGKLIDILELQSIVGLDTEIISRLLPFVNIGTNTASNEEITYKNLSTFSEHDLVIRFASVFEKQSGFQNSSGSHYLGSKTKLLWRYKYEFSNRISAALILEKDAGEKMFMGSKQLILDYSSVHLAINNTGLFDKIVIGDFTMQFGQGLTLWSGFAFGKAADVASVAKRDIGLKPYSSANEFSFLRGIASTLKLTKNLRATIFGSLRKLDASIDSTAEGAESLSNINETGYHRTLQELKNKNSLRQIVYGGVLQYQLRKLNLGLVTYQTIFNKEFSKSEEPYRHYYFTGKQLINIGINYSYTFKNLYLFGETAKSLQGGLATINGILFSLSAKLSGVILHRIYDKNYHNFFNQATAESSDATNENGTYVGLNFSPKKSIIISLYVDYFDFPWLKFRIDAPSKGYEILGQVTYTPSKTFKVITRCKSEQKNQNTSLNVPINYLVDIGKNSYRLDIDWALTNNLNLQNRIEYNTYSNDSNHSDTGYLIYQDIAYHPNKSKLSGNFRLAYFSTESFNSRIYAYEDDVLYNFSFAAYSETGFRFYLNTKYRLFKNIDIWLRYGLFFYPKKTTIGSGLDEISGNKKSDIKFQLRYQF